MVPPIHPPAYNYILLKLVQILYGNFINSGHGTSTSSFGYRLSVYVCLTLHLTYVLRQTCFQRAQTLLGHASKRDSGSNTSSTSTLTGAGVWHSPTLGEVTLQKSPQLWLLWTEIDARTLYSSDLSGADWAFCVCHQGANVQVEEEIWTLCNFCPILLWRSFLFPSECNKVANDKLKGN